MAEGTGYALTSYGDMITERPRMDPYVQALRKAVEPGDVVLDIGAGTGVFSLIACQLGAGCVHAVEPDEAIQVARKSAQANGYADRIVFHQTLSTDVTLPERADVIVSDLRGVLPLFQHHIPSIVDARHRLLAPEGRLIPTKDTLWATLVDAPKVYQPFETPWLNNEYGLDMRAGHPLAINSWMRTHSKPDQILVQPQAWATLDYWTIESADVSGRLAWTVERNGTAHGIILWFDTDLYEGLGFSNAPGLPELIYGHAFFPLERPVSLDAGDYIDLRLKANLVDGEYIWRWDTRITDRASSQAKAEFHQSTFYGTSVDPKELHKQASGFTPSVNQQGQLDRLALELMDGNHSLGNIAEAIIQRFPEVFPDWEHTLAHVGKLSKKYSL